MSDKNNPYASPKSDLDTHAHSSPVATEPLKVQQNWYQQILTRKMLICLFTGFSSGLPLYLLLNLIPAWLYTSDINIKAIGLFGLVQFPYTWKFVWSPLIDRINLPFLGKRRGWMFFTQSVLLLLICSFAFTDPKSDLSFVAIVCFAIAFFSASQDIVLDAFRREILDDNELGLGNTLHVNTYRLAGLIPGSLSLILANFMPWSIVFIITALFMLPGVFMSLFLAKEPPANPKAPKNFQESIVEPFREFFTRKGALSALLILLFIFLYKLGDSMATSLATPFYLSLGFSKLDVGLVAKSAGLIPAIISGILGGIFMLKIGINKALWLFGVVQVVSILGFVWISTYGHFDTIGAFERTSLAIVIGFEAVGVGLGTAAFVSFMARETNPAFTATQLALFTSLSAVPRTLINSSTGYLISWLGYTNFFWLCFALAFPGMVLLFWVAPWNEKKQPKA